MAAMAAATTAAMEQRSVVSRAISPRSPIMPGSLNRGKVVDCSRRTKIGSLSFEKESCRDSICSNRDNAATGDRAFPRRAITLHNARLVFSFHRLRNPSTPTSSSGDRAGTFVRMLRGYSYDSSLDTAFHNNSFSSDSNAMIYEYESVATRSCFKCQQ